MTYGIEFIAVLGAFRLLHHDPALLVVTLTIEGSTDQPISLRISNERAAFEGRLVLGRDAHSSIEKVAPKSPRSSRPHWAIKQRRSLDAIGNVRPSAVSHLGSE